MEKQTKRRRPSKRAGQPEQPKRPRGRPPIVKNYYASALDAAAAIALKYAMDLEGLDEEIALLRTKLRDLVSETKDKKQKESFAKRPDGMKLMIRGMELLAKLLAARYRMSAKSQEDLAAHIAGLIQGVGEEFYPEGRHGSTA
jgi:hypothetical protein